MNPKPINQKKVTRFAFWGAVITGLTGFAVGAFICLHYRLPIPPLFITEMGMLVGGCLGALCALTDSERKVLPFLVTSIGVLLVTLGFGVEWLHSLGGALALGVVVWNMVDTPCQESATWRNL